MAGYPGKQGRKLNASTIVERLRDSTVNDQMPPCPKWISLEAKRIWRREAPALHKSGLLSYSDGPAFANYCLIRAELRQAYAQLGESLTFEYTNKNGSTNEIAKPQVAIIHKCLELLKSYAAEFGMTPASRTRIPASGEVLKHKVNPQTKAAFIGDPRSLLGSHN